MCSGKTKILAHAELPVEIEIAIDVAVVEAEIAILFASELIGIVDVFAARKHFRKLITHSCDAHLKAFSTEVHIAAIDDLVQCSLISQLTRSAVKSTAEDGTHLFLYFRERIT